jgi:hypothetical protein
MTDESADALVAQEPSRGRGLRSISLRVLAISAGVVVAASAIAYGVLTDSALIPGNHAYTGDRTGGPVALDMQIAQAVGGRCDQGGLSWQEGSIPAVFDQSLTVTNGVHDYWSSPFCVRLNPATSTLTTASGRVSIENLIETDPACSPGEVLAGDTNCGTEAPGTGEISQAITWYFYAASADCANIQGGVPPVSLTPGLLESGSTIGPTGVGSTNPTCVAFRLATNLVSDDPRLNLIQSDSATWDWRFTASE